MTYLVGRVTSENGSERCSDQLFHQLKFRSRRCSQGAMLVVERLLALTLETNAVTGMLGFMSSVCPVQPPCFTALVAMATAIMFVSGPLAPPVCIIS